MAHLHVQLIHILFSGPLLIYVGLMQPKYVWVYRLLLALGIVVAAMFALRLIRKWPWGQDHVWYIVHAVLFAGLLIYVGWMGPGAPHVAFSLLLAVGIAAVGYHLVRLIQ